MPVILAKWRVVVKAIRFRGSALKAGALLGLILLSVGGDASASSNGMPPSRLLFRTYGTEQGLDNLAVEAVAQGALGFLWVATQDGLYRFDGQRFTRFGVEDGLPNALLTSVIAGRDGDLWVGTVLGAGPRSGGPLRAGSGLGDEPRRPRQRAGARHRRHPVGGPVRGALHPRRERSVPSGTGVAGGRGDGGDRGPGVRQRVRSLGNPDREARRQGFVAFLGQRISTPANRSKV